MTDHVSTPGDLVGVIGFGLVGAAVTKRLRERGFRVLAHDISDDRRAALAAAGLPIDTSLSQIAEQCATVFLCVYSREQAEGVIDLLAAQRADHHRAISVAVCITTLEPDAAVSLAGRATQMGCQFLEYPISGTSKQISEGQGFGLLAGRESIIAHLKHLIAAVTPRTAYFGEIGMAARAKLTINLVLEINRSALAEGLVFAELLGLPPALALEALRSSAAHSHVMDAKGPKMLSREFSPESRCSQSLKDVDLMLRLADRQGHSLPLAAVQRDLLSSCEAQGEGTLDVAVVINEIRRRKTRRAARTPYTLTRRSSKC